jgi:hypothetical protein
MTSFRDLLKEGENQKKIQAVTSIKDINDYFEYDDKTRGGKGDSPLVSCGQNGTYNELEYIYDTYLALFVATDKDTSKEKVLQAMCKACFDLTNPRSRSDFYNYIEKELDCDLIFHDHLKK